MDVLQMEGLIKRFGHQDVLKEVSFSVPEHSIFGFIGQNGAGKTTTMRIILGLLKQDAGRVTVCGETAEYGQTRTNRFIGYLPDVPEYYNFMNPHEYLQLCGDVTGIDKNKMNEKSSELLGVVGLDGSSKKRIGGFSRGMKQRLGIAQALLNEPRLLICDEPTSALDPIGRKEILDILKAVKDRTTVLFSTHILTDVERICDRVAILHDGRIAITGKLSELKKKQGVDSLEIEFAKPSLRKQFQQAWPSDIAAEMKTVNPAAVCIQAKEIDKVQVEVFGIMHKYNLIPLVVRRKEPSLESIFMGVVT